MLLITKENMAFFLGFKSSRSTSDLLTVVSDRIARDINRSEGTGTVAPGISKAFNTVWHVERIYKLNSYGKSYFIYSQ